jgi:enolase-phosphatase E1
MIRKILTDIEGTTSSIEFVHKVLFPFSRTHIGDFLSSSTDPEVKLSIQSLWYEDLKGTRDSKPDVMAVTALLQDWIDSDAKHPILKLLQGKIWRFGYESGAYKGHVYPDVRKIFEIWDSNGLSISIYSSGSVEAQKLLFRHSEAGDLTKIISHYFDTEVGPKRNASSYVTIAHRLKSSAEEILFLSDIKEELDAAREAGMKTIQLLREPLPPQGDHESAGNFEEVLMKMKI